jgi:hypothetical protein
VRCYWQKTQKSLPFLASIAQQGGGHALTGADSTVPDINGENVRLIAVLLTQVRARALFSFERDVRGDALFPIPSALPSSAWAA